MKLFDFIKSIMNDDDLEIEMRDEVIMITSKSCGLFYILVSNVTLDTEIHHF